jgi:hypothetical protein
MKRLREKIEELDYQKRESDSKIKEKEKEKILAD